MRALRNGVCLGLGSFGSFRVVLVAWQINRNTRPQKTNGTFCSRLAWATRGSMQTQQFVNPSGKQSTGSQWPSQAEGAWLTTDTHCLASVKACRWPRWTPCCSTPFGAQSSIIASLFFRLSGSKILNGMGKKGCLRVQLSSWLGGWYNLRSTAATANGLY